MKSVEDYKKDVISIIQEMEKEHGCNVRTLCVHTESFYSANMAIVSKKYTVEIDMQ